MKKPLADRIAPPHQLANGEWRGVRLPLALARALLQCWLAGEDYHLLFPEPRCPYEIATIIDRWIESDLRERSRSRAGEHGVRDWTPTAVLHQLACVRMLPWRKFVEDVTVDQLVNGVLVGDWLSIEHGARMDRHRCIAAVAQLETEGLIAVGRPQGLPLRVTINVDAVLAWAGDLVAMAALEADGPEFGGDFVDGELVVFEGEEEPMLVPGVNPCGQTAGVPLRSDGRGQEGDPCGQTAVTGNSDVSNGEEQDWTDLATASVPPPTVLVDEVEAAAPSQNTSRLEVPREVIRWLREEGMAVDPNCTGDLSRSAQRRLLGTSVEGIRQAFHFADEWRRRARANRKDAAEDQLVALATVGSLVQHRLVLMTMLNAQPKVKASLPDPLAEVHRLLAGLHPLWVETRLNRMITRRPDIDDPWPYLATALSNRTEHDLWIKQKRPASIIEAAKEKP